MSSTSMSRKLQLVNKSSTFLFHININVRPTVCKLVIALRVQLSLKHIEAELDIR